jgi:cytochrome P450
MSPTESTETVPEAIRLAREAKDPFEAFDYGMGMYTTRDPFPRYEKLRAEGPLLETDLSTWYPPLVPPGEDPLGWVALSYRAVTHIAREAEIFSSSKYQVTGDAVMGKNLLSMDPPEHTRYRNLINQAFSPKALESWERDVVRPLTRQTIEEFAERGRADLTRDLTFRFPARIIARLFGVPDEHLGDFQRWGVELQCVLFDFDRGVEASRKLTELFREVIEDHRQRPRPDLLSGLIDVELDGERLDEEEILGFMRLLLPAGIETTYRGAGNVFFSLLTHPEQLAAVNEDRGLLRRTVEEALRWQPMLAGGLRFATRDAEIEGVKLREGDMVYLCWAAANRDPVRWRRPERFDIHRDYLPHLTFGYGAHRCLGIHLARLEMKVALELAMDLLPGLRLDLEAEDVHVSGDGFRGPVSLPVVWDA